MNPKLIEKCLYHLGLDEIPRPDELRDRLWGLDLLCERAPIPVPEWLERRHKTRVLLLISELIHPETHDESMG